MEQQCKEQQHLAGCNRGFSCDAANAKCWAWTCSGLGSGADVGNWLLLSSLEEAKIKEGLVLQGNER